MVTHRYTNKLCLLQIVKEHHRQLVIIVVKIFKTFGLVVAMATIILRDITSQILHCLVQHQGYGPYRVIAIWGERVPFVLVFILRPIESVSQKSYIVSGGLSETNVAN